MKTKIITLAFLLIISSLSYAIPRRALIEFTTSTSCQYCPCMDDILENQIMVLYPGTVVMAYHGIIPPNLDPFAYYLGNILRDSLRGPEVGFTAPVAWIDRAYFYRVDIPHIKDTVIHRYTNSPNSPVEITIVSKVYNPATRQLNVTVDLKALQNLNGLFKVNFAITENNIVYPQFGNSTCPGGQNYIHKWVTRTIVDGGFGEQVINGNWNQNQIFTKNLSVTLDTGWVSSNCDYSIWVYKYIENITHSEVQQSFRASVTGSIGIQNEATSVEGYSLSQNYPNPFNPQTSIRFSIPKNNFVSLKIYNSIGKEVSTLCNMYLKSGVYNAIFDATSLPSGIYFYKLIAGDFSETKKMILIR